MKRGETVRGITHNIMVNGPMTLADLSAALGKHKSYVHPVIARMMKPTTKPAMPKRLYVVQYVYDQEGMRKYPRAMYALGEGPDAPHPGRNKNAKREYLQRKRAHQTTNSVFNLAGAVLHGNFQINF